MQIDKLFTKNEANKEKELQIYLPDGKKSGETITVLGTDSDKFRDHKRELNRKVLEGTLKGGPDEMAAMLLAGLVTAWSFETEFTQANVVKLLMNAPSLMDQIDQFVSTKANFTGGD